MNRQKIFSSLVLFGLIILQVACGSSESVSTTDDTDDIDSSTTSNTTSLALSNIVGTWALAGSDCDEGCGYDPVEIVIASDGAMSIEYEEYELGEYGFPTGVILGYDVFEGTLTIDNETSMYMTLSDGDIMTFENVALDGNELSAQINDSVTWNWEKEE